MAQRTEDLTPLGDTAQQVRKNLTAVRGGHAQPDSLARWQTWMEVEKGLAPNTRKLYGRTIEALEHDLGNPENLTAEEIRTWLHLKKCAAGTTSNRISALTSYYSYLVRTDARLDNPCDKLDRPKSAKGLPRPVQDLEAALLSLDELDRRVGRKVGESRAMATFLAETGLRIHEAVALDVKTPCADTLRLRGKGAKDAILPLTPKAREALDFLGGRWPIGARATQRRFEKASPAFSPHQLRHWRGTSMAEAGCDLGDIQHALRHASPATTLVYAAWSTDRVRAALAKVT